MTTLFYKALIFLGLRKTDNTTVQKKSRMADIIQRKIIQKQRVTRKRNQPRKITRQVFKNNYKKDLSPNLRKSMEENLEIKLNINVEQKRKLREYFKIFLSWIYTVLIFLMLCVQPIYILVYILTHDEPNPNFYISSLFCFCLLLFFL